MKKLLLATAAALAISGAHAPALALDQAGFEAKIASITAEYEPKLEALERQAKALDDDMPSKEELLINIDIDEMSEVRFSMHIPEVTMDRWEYSMHIPEVTMKLRKFSWTLPDCRWDLVDFGLFKTDFLKCGPKLHEWSMKVPEVTMRHRKFSMDIPEITMKQRDFSFHVPKVSIGGPQDRMDTMKSDGNAIQAEASKIAQQMKAEISQETRAFLLESRSEAEKQFQFALNTFDAGISSAPSEEVKDKLVEQRNEVIQQRAKVLAEMDAQLSALS